MADISKELEAWRSASYGKDVRQAQIDLSTKLNEEVENGTEIIKTYEAAENERADAESKRKEAENERVEAEAKRQTDTDEAIERNNEATAEAIKRVEEKADDAINQNKNATAEAIKRSDAATARANKAAQAAEDVVVGKGFIPTSEKGAAGGVATLGTSGKVLDEQLPDINETELFFNQSPERNNVVSGEKLKITLGKIAKWFSDLKNAAFCTVVNNATTTEENTVLDGRMGKTLMDTMMPKSGGEFDGDVRVKDGNKVLWGNKASVFGNGNQHLFLTGDDDGNYAAHLGVHDNMWTLDPDVDSNLQLGTPNHRWGTLYAKTGQINTSDRNTKRNIKEIDDKYLDFFMRLMPVSFQFTDGIRTHIGFVSQDVEDAMTASGLTDLDFAGFCKDAKTVRVKKTKTVETGRNSTETVTCYEDVEVPGEYVYSLRYDEFVALNTAMIKQLVDRVTALEERAQQRG